MPWGLRGRHLLRAGGPARPRLRGAEPGAQPSFRAAPHRGL